MDLDRLNKALATYEVAEHIYKVDDGKTLSEALRLLENANADNDENMNDDDADPLSLKQALKHRAAPTGARSPTADKQIVLGKHKTRVSFGGIERKNTSKSFDAAASKVDRVSKSMAEDENCVPWKKRNVSANQVATVKRAVLKSVAARKEGFEGHFSVNEQATAILRLCCSKGGRHESKNSCRIQTEDRSHKGPIIWRNGSLNEGGFHH
jgi:hypothetical protein